MRQSYRDDNGVYVRLAMAVAVLFLIACAVPTVSRAAGDPLDELDKQLKKLYTESATNLKYTKSWEEKIKMIRRLVPLLEKKKAEIAAVALKERPSRTAIPEEDVKSVIRNNKVFAKAMKTSMDHLGAVKNAPAAMARPITRGRHHIKKCTKILTSVVKMRNMKLQTIYALHQSQ